jgi:hypothetical protein
MDATTGIYPTSASSPTSQMILKSSSPLLPEASSPVGANDDDDDDWSVDISANSTPTSTSISQAKLLPTLGFGSGRINAKKSSLSSPVVSTSASSSSLSAQHAVQSSVQMFIDVGQKDLGEKVCKECGMMFHTGVRADELSHKTFCDAHKNGPLVHVQTNLIHCPRLHHTLSTLPSPSSAFNAL